MAVNLKKAQRRTLHFNTLADILADAQTITAAPHHTTGNWTAPQIIDHVTRVMGFSNHGTDLRLPLPMRLFGSILKRTGGYRKPISPGVKLPQSIVKHFVAPSNITLDDAISQLRTEIETATTTDMSHPSPFFGSLTHDQWIPFHCRHAELHFSFILAD
ncbi:MAG: DUF1569 domain-containing protein [Algisphaera sp.]